MLDALIHTNMKQLLGSLVSEHNTVSEPNRSRTQPESNTTPF